MKIILTKCQPRATNLRTNIYNAFALLFFSSVASNYNNTDNIIAVKSYSNADTMKEDILKDNKGKSGIYLWIRNDTGDSYVGSAVDLRKRLRKYYTYSQLTNNMIINKALLKHGYSNFSLKILEYCDKTDLLTREQYYFDLLCPKYNILKTAGNSIGYKHSPEVKKLISDRMIGLFAGDKNPLFGKTHSEETKKLISQNLSGRILSEETKNLISKALTGDKHPFYGITRSDKTKKLISEALMGENNPLFGKTHSDKTKEKISEAKGSTIYLYSLDKELLESFISARKAAEYLDSSHKTIMKYARSGEIFKEKYILIIKSEDLASKSK